MEIRGLRFRIWSPETDHPRSKKNILRRHQSKAAVYGRRRLRGYLDFRSLPASVYRATKGDLPRKPSAILPCRFVGLRICPPVRIFIQPPKRFKGFRATLLRPDVPLRRTTGPRLDRPTEPDGSQDSDCKGLQRHGVDDQVPLQKQKAAPENRRCL